MVEYIYFVKCPGCEDEHFDFFDEAKSFAMDCLSKKPIITQIEVCRNDFGECTDSCDLGTIWSWEDLMTDVPDEDELSVFTKDDLVDYDADNDPEFVNMDNSVDYEPETSEISSLDSVPDNFKKPIPEEMTIKQIVEAMEENEDTVECTWCNDLFDKSECRYEVNLGYLCSRCEDAIKSRGETLTFRENNYWDFLDESVDPFDHHDPDYDEEDAAEYVANQIDKVWDARHDSAVDTLTESTSEDKTVELHYDALTITLCGPMRDADDWDEVEHTDSYVYYADKVVVEEELWDLLTDEDAKDISGGLDTLAEDDKAWEAFLENNFDTLVDKYYDKLLEIFKEDAKEEFEENYTWSDYQHDLELNRDDYEFHMDR